MLIFMLQLPTKRLRVEHEMLCGFMALYNYSGPLGPGLNFVKNIDVFLFSVYFILRATLNC